MIVTAQPFFNELDLLEIKCRTLAGVVDAHVIVEATTTFTGLPKPLYFAENEARFREFNIFHHVIELPTAVPSPWDREKYQYDAVRELVKKLCPEIVLWVDADECPRPDVVQRFKGMNVECATLDMDQLLYFFDRVDPSLRWTNGKIGRYNPTTNPQPWRGQTHWPILPDAGWHFEYFGSRETLVDKMNAVSHAPELPCIENRKQMERGERPGFEKTMPYDLTRLPAYVANNREWFKSSFSQP